MKTNCIICKIFATLAAIGALNWGSIGILDVNFVEALLGMGTLTRVVYVLVGLSGIFLLVTTFIRCCPCQKK